MTDDRADYIIDLIRARCGDVLTDADLDSIAQPAAPPVEPDRVPAYAPHRRRIRHKKCHPNRGFFKMDAVLRCELHYNLIRVNMPGLRRI
jgi:hypothetical protein